MNSNIKKDIINSIDKTLLALKKDNFESLKELSNHNIHNASIYYDEYSIILTVIIYSLSKIFLKPFNKDLILNLLTQMKNSMKNNNLNLYQTAQKQLLTYIEKIDKEFSSYISQVLTQAQIKKSTLLYEHGLSIETAAHILGISQWDLMNYLGNVKTTNFAVPKTDIKSRIEFTRSLFK